ncbi:type II toxin-antitoxin system VapC family toxin [Sphingobium limneticum]|uniref:Type II toxin-antitoxin system VapC family toxin n=1 Tax=Sphingobium limneticum TaxID=1007511 RepID=A0A5J5HT91_9SPHN|nr:type II toxin-antitoxin system VapC family toxin [Sphingobium sp. YC-XJ3]KAA9011847.1 type II toxin-antitoxin system VapC family toxin [Sphingobium limneticum]KAA9012936.1 type II toxin-antitoxin system VapC family toxin [Sphingobium limneticum]KAA9025182.1 type II toxin-antitoxin system VapC family toxin [Sphingobium limneticum]WDA35080.1 type II toxin-antitoxin system VapC family toxin [Sphingobium sp. YC-XJ3]
MTDRIYVLDASALLSLLFQEPGAAYVEARLPRALVSAVNYHEVLAKLIDRGVEPNEASAMLAELDIDIIAVDREQANIGGAFRAVTRSAGLSLGDRSCLALAQIRGGVAVTVNQAWAMLDIPIQVEHAR